MTKRFRARKPQRSLRMRPSGAVFVLVYGLVQLAAFNTAENLLYMVAGGTVSFLAVSLWFTRTTLRRLNVRREAPHAAHRGTPFPVKLKAENAKRWFPAASLRVSFSDDPTTIKGYIEHIPRKSGAELSLDFTMAKRGVHALPSTVLSTAFPLGLFERSVTLSDDREVVVYPRVYPVRWQTLEQLDASGAVPRPLLRDGDEYFALRQYQPGDDIRLISWRISARRGELIIRELEPSTTRTVVVIFDTRARIETPEQAEHFEDAVDLAASVSVALLERGYTAALITPDGLVGLGFGKAHEIKILEALARVQPSVAAAGEDWQAALSEMAGAGRMYISADRSLWGTTRSGGGRVLNPLEASHA